MPDDVYQRLRTEVIDAGICTHCGTCVGLSGGRLAMQDSGRGPLPQPRGDDLSCIDELAYQACPGLGVNYPGVSRWLFQRLPESWLVGVTRKTYLGYALAPDIRRAASSGGVITQVLIYLLNTGRVDGAVVLRHGSPENWLSSPIIAQSVEQIRAAAQSVYVPTPVNTILDRIGDFEGRLAYVGLPDQVAAIRRLQQLGHAGARKIEYIIGPYVGTSMYLGSLRSYLRSKGGRTLEDVAELRYREGEWPGFLQIKLKSGEVLREKKFYYNYLIPFYLTTSTLLSVDFTNELTDISVGDAWHPRLEKQGQGFSVVLARSEQSLNTLNLMRDAGLLSLEDISLDEALAMHGHMLDFKKRGTFIRLQWRARFGSAVPRYGYAPENIPLSRKVVELVISSLLYFGRLRWARFLAERIPLSILGPFFNTLRKAWKWISKPTKRSGLRSMIFIVDGEESG